MPHFLNRLTKRSAAAIVEAKVPGFHADGKGLYLQVSKHGAASWILLYRVKTRRRKMGLGSLRLVSLDEARRQRDEAHKLLSRGIDPIDARPIRRAETLENQIAAKAPEFDKAGIKPACYLYRHYDPRGDLIYVGVTLSPLRRNEAHIVLADWRRTILKILIEPFATREEALEAESRAIREEFPRFNKTHNQRRHPADELRKLGD